MSAAATSDVRLAVLPGVLDPPTDSWLLADEIKASGMARGADVLDLCCGSGVLGICAALAGARTVTAIDAGLGAVVNTTLNSWRNRVRMEVLRGDLFEPVADRAFDLIVTNPPYLPSTDDSLPTSGPGLATEAGVDGRHFLDRICRSAHRYLRPGGSLLLVQSSVADVGRSIEQLGETRLEASPVRHHRGPLGPRLAARVGALRARQLLAADHDHEELVVIKATRPG